MLTLVSPLSQLAGVGPFILRRLRGLGIDNVFDLINYFPRRWLDLSEPSYIKDLVLNEEAIIKAKVLDIKNTRTAKKRMILTKVTLVDDSKDLKALFFNQPYLINYLKVGSEWFFLGKLTHSLRGLVFMVSSYEKEGGILPVYPETEGITSKYLRRLIKPLLSQVDSLADFLPDEILRGEGLLELRSALKQIHFSDNQYLLAAAKKRLSFDEIFLIALRMLSLKKEIQSADAPAIKIDLRLLKKFVTSLPFNLTKSQKIALWDILSDLKKTSPMNRLLQGEVGSGKTVVAAAAALMTIQNGYQAVWLAPTEILAKQHYQNLSKLLSPFKIKIGLLTAETSKDAPVITKEFALILGTHALIQENVSFPNLGFVIVDEQHRFGVKQRSHLRSTQARTGKLDLIPHFLSLTATPIPRTLALTIFGDLDVSVIPELPQGRHRIQTKAVLPSDRAKAYDFIRSQVKKGRQVFVVCPLIEPKNTKRKISLFDIERKSAKKEYEKLKNEVFPDLRIGLLHGKMSSQEKEKVMRRFSQKEIDLLVTTAVIEVGIDIQNATVMMIEGAERFGLAQLHQFRGRVGRGKHQSYCFLFTESLDLKTKKRLKALVESQDGFALAEVDLELRGPGEFVGIRQSGMPDLKMASLSDIILVDKARLAASQILEKGLENFPQLADKLAQFIKTSHLE